MGHQDPLGALISPTRLGQILLLSLALALSGASADSLRILTQNMNRLFDDVDDGNDEKVLSRGRFQRRVETAAEKFGHDYSLPDVIALQEVENLNVLRRISARIERRHGARYRAVIRQGQDISGINVAYLVRRDLEIRKVDQLYRGLPLPDSKIPLFSRPPLYLEVCRAAQCFALLNLHLRSMRGLDDESARERVAQKRRLQAEAIARWVDRFQRQRRDASLLLLGDFNALTPSDEHVDVVGIIRGNPDNGRTRIAAPDLVEPDLLDLTLRVAPGERFSYVFRRRRQQLDYMLVNETFAADPTSIGFGRIDYRFSDHAGLLTRFEW